MRKNIIIISYVVSVFLLTTVYLGRELWLDDLATDTNYRNCRDKCVNVHNTCVANDRGALINFFYILGLKNTCTINYTTCVSGCLPAGYTLADPGEKVLIFKRVA